jgi:hypothetical protein
VELNMNRTLRETVTACFLIATAGVLLGCNQDLGTVFTRRMEARRLAADLRIAFNGATDASNRAVMADTDEASIAFAKEAEQAKQTVQLDADALAPLLRGLDYSEELRQLGEFSRCYGEYQKLDHDILELAVENSNLKAQRLAFGPGREAVAEFRKELDAIVAAAAPKNKCQITSLAGSAVIALLQIQVSQPPHIAESDDAVMTGMEKDMVDKEAAVRSALGTLAGLIQPASQAQLATANAALDRFKGIHTQIIALSRRNTNVRSLALALGPARKLITTCDGSLVALAAAFANERDKATR